MLLGNAIIFGSSINIGRRITNVQKLKEVKKSYLFLFHIKIISKKFNNRQNSIFWEKMVELTIELYQAWFSLYFVRHYCCNSQCSPGIWCWKTKARHKFFFFSTDNQIRKLTISSSPTSTQSLHFVFVNWGRRGPWAGISLFFNDLTVKGFCIPTIMLCGEMEKDIWLQAHGKRLCHQIAMSTLAVLGSLNLDFPIFLRKY